MTLRQFYDWQTLGGAKDVSRLVAALEEREISWCMSGGLGFEEKRFDWSINFKGDSKISIQISTEKMYLDFPSRSVPTEVHGILMRVASLEDTLEGKLAAFSAPERRGSKRMKDLLDISRLLETNPQLKEKIPTEIFEKLEV